MSYTITPSENGRYIVCRVQGRISGENVLADTRELDEMSRTLNIQRFLNDVRDAFNDLGILGNYNFAYKDMSELNLQRDVRAAILVNPTDNSHDFLETVARNAGYGMRLFRNEEAAIAWLDE